MKVLKYNTLTLAIVSLLSVSGLASAQSTAPVTTDANGNTIAGPCTSGSTTYSTDSSGNLILCSQNDVNRIGTSGGTGASNNNIVIGSAAIDGGLSDNISIGRSNTITTFGQSTGSNVLLGNNIRLQGYYNVALGDGSLSGATGGFFVTSIGANAFANAKFAGGQSPTSVAVGASAGNNASQVYNATLVGPGAGQNATQVNFSTAYGSAAGASASMFHSDAIGESAGRNSSLSYSEVIGANAGTLSTLTNSVALGSQAAYQANGGNNTYVGGNAGYLVSGSGNTIVGGGSTPAARSVSGLTAIGSGATGYFNGVAVGTSANASGNTSSAIGTNSVASGVSALALGSSSSSTAANAVALGAGAVADQANTVSVGNSSAQRRVVNVAGGQAANDAATLGQLNSTTQALGAGASFSGGTFVAPLYAVKGVNYTDVGSAIGAVNGTIKYIEASSSTAFSAPSVYAGSDSLSIGSGASSNSAYSVAIGNGTLIRSADPTQPLGATAVGQTARVDGSGTAVGVGAAVFRADGALTIVQATAIGDSAHAQASQTTALGAGSQALATGSVAIGAGAVADQVNTVSIGDATGGATATRRLVNLAAGQASSDAVNVGQLNTATQALGAGASYAGGTFVAPTYNIQGGSYNNVGSALDAVDSSLSSITTAAGDALRWNAAIGAYDASRAGEPSQIKNVQAGTAGTDAVNVDQLNAVASGSTLAVQYDSALKTTITLGGAGAGQAVAIDNLADGQVAAGSHDAVNGGQLFNANLVVNNLGTSMANVFGGGASYVGGIFTAPVFMVQGGSFNTVAGAFNAVDAKLTNLDQRTTVLEGTGVGGTGPQGPQGPAGSSAYQLAVANGFTGSESAWLTSLQGKDGKDGLNGTNAVGGGDPNALVYDDASRSSVTVAPGQAPATVKNVAAGTAGTDAVNVTQLDQAITTAKSYSDAGDVKTLSSANTYTDQRISQLNSALDDRFHKVDQRIDRTGAMGTAMSQMAMAGAGAAEGGRVAAGVGLQGSAGAVAVGFAAPVGERGHVNFGGAFSTGTATVGAGFGWDLH